MDRPKTIAIFYYTFNIFSSEISRKSIKKCRNIKEIIKEYLKIRLRYVIVLTYSWSNQETNDMGEKNYATNNDGKMGQP